VERSGIDGRTRTLIARPPPFHGKITLARRGVPVKCLPRPSRKGRRLSCRPVNLRKSATLRPSRSLSQPANVVAWSPDRATTSFGASSGGRPGTLLLPVPPCDLEDLVDGRVASKLFSRLPPFLGNGRRGSLRDISLSAGDCAGDSEYNRPMPDLRWFDLFKFAAERLQLSVSRRPSCRNKPHPGPLAWLNRNHDIQ